MSEAQKKSDNRSNPTTEDFRRFVTSGWAPRAAAAPERAPVAPYAAARRNALSRRFPGERLVVPAGGLKVRSNDCDYRFRPHSAFAHLTGFGSDEEPDAVLVLEPRLEDGHDAVLFVKPLGGRDSDEFFEDTRYGEFWVGSRPTLEEVEAGYGVSARHVDDLADAVAKDAGHVAIRVVRDADRDVTRLVDEARASASQWSEGESGGANDAAAIHGQVDADEELASVLSALRLVKDEWEVQQMRLAVAATQEGFDAVVGRLGEAVDRGRGERWVEGLFGLYARHRGNGVGYDSICASGDHATTLHWVKNTGDVQPGDLLLLDAGVEVDSLYTADVTRTVPVDGTFTDVQRQVYDAVFAAQQAAMEVVRPGVLFSAVHDAAIRVIAEHLHEWGLLPRGVTVEDTLDTEHGQYHRRWMVHGTSHHLGLDVHDCALAKRSEYKDAPLRAGMILTVEPGLYFKADDELVPPALRGIGVRIEDDVLVTEDGYENLSAGLPRTADDVEAWVSCARADHAAAPPTRSAQGLPPYSVPVDGG